MKITIKFIIYFITFFKIHIIKEEIVVVNDNVIDKNM